MNGPLLVLDTATRQPVIALAAPDGRLLGARQWTSRHRHGEELIQRLDELLSEAGVARADIGGVIVGTGPGSFTGLRIGLATAKVIAYSLGVPLRGVSTTVALARAAAEGRTGRTVAVVLPAGAADRYVHRLKAGDDGVLEVEPPQLVGNEAEYLALVDGYQVVAVDFDAPPGGADPALGLLATSRLAGALAEMGARQLAAGLTDDPHTLVPAYVALPRGIARTATEMTWSPDLR